MSGTIKKLFALLSPRDRLYLGLLFIAILGAAVLELASVAAVLPFLTVAANPAVIAADARFAWAFEWSGASSPEAFLVALGIGAFLVLLISNAWMATTTWAQARFAHGFAHTLGLRLIEHYSAQPYVNLLTRNTADLGKNILTEAWEVMNTVILPCLQVLTRSFIVLAICGLLVAVDPLLAGLVSLVLGGAYALIFLIMQRRLRVIGNKRLISNSARFKAVNELFGGIKDLKLLGRQQMFIRAFREASARNARLRASAAIMAQMPRYLLETIAFGGILLIAVYMLLRGGDLPAVIPALGLYAFAGYRLMPSLQQVFHGLTQLRFGAAALDNLCHEMAGVTPSSEKEESRPPRQRAFHPPPRLPFNHDLVLDRVTFTYPGALRPSLRDVTLTIEANTTVGFIGKTGSGKTTLIDIILGLLQPDVGEIRIDGERLTEDTCRAWQANIGYVPQQIYLADDTVAKNIAFGVPDTEIDMTAVARAAALANIDSFIRDEMPKGYQTLVGERGIRLSGGQRQRIGIARALYHNPPMLVFDEATSALDNETEASVMEAVHMLTGCKTILMIAHRTSTLADCDLIVELSDGAVVDSPAPHLAHRTALS
jgi:ATP-binding cassette, subfamily B, bacterial PglK